MKVLVTGRRGQLAQALQAHTTAEIVAIGRPELDVTRADTVARALDATAADVVVNTAAFTAVDSAESHSTEAHAVNAAGAGNVARAAATAGVPVIHVSTDYVFDGEKGRPYVEGDRADPKTVYGRSKLAGEDAVRLANPHHVVLRCGWLFSPYGSNFLTTMLSLAQERTTLSVVNDQRGNPTSADELARVIISLATIGIGGGTAWGTYHAGGAAAATWCEFARAIFESSASQGGPSAQVVAITSAEFGSAAVRPADTRLDCTRLSDTFGLTIPGWDSVIDAGVTSALRAPRESTPSRCIGPSGQ